MKVIHILTTSVLILSFIDGSIAQITLEALRGNPAIQAHALDSNLKKYYVLTGKEIVICATQNYDELKFSEKTHKRNLSGQILEQDDFAVYQAGPSAGIDTLELVNTHADTIQTKQIVVEVQASIDLPFMDDFGYSNDGEILPDPLLWQDQSVYINDHFAFAPPSLGVATFDGTDVLGNAYGQEGSADTLTSCFINLSDNNAGDSIYLTFYLQAGGYGYPPNNNEPFILEMKNNQGTWLEIDRISTDRIVDWYTGFAYNINEFQYFHESFQFRFRNINPGVGVSNIWNLDYVRVIQGAFLSEVLDVNDLAWAHAPYSFLKNYTAIPLKHLLPNLEDEINDSFQLDVFNHKADVEEINNGRFDLIDSENGIDIRMNGELFEDAITRNVPSRAIYTVHSKILDIDFSNIVQAISSTYNANDRTKLSLSFDLNEPDQEGLNSILENDKATTVQDLTDYFAYDDGSAELRINVPLGAAIATQFTMQANDRLKGVILGFPDLFSSPEGLNFDLEIRENSINGNLLYERSRLNISDMERLARFPGYFFYEFEEADPSIDVDAGRAIFVIVKSDQEPLAMGFDLQFDRLNNSFIKPRGSDWTGMENIIGIVPGAVQIRLVNDDFIVSNDEKISSSILVYPNPAQNTIQLYSGSPYKTYKILNSQGTVVKEGININNQIDISKLNSGSFTLILIDNKNIISTSFIKQLP